MDEGLRELLARVDDAEVRQALERELADLIDRRRVGLLFERHLPEVVSLPTVRPRRGLFARRRHGDSRLLRIVRVRGGVATCDEQRRADDPHDWSAPRIEIAVADLTTVARFGDAIHPGVEILGALGAEVTGAPTHLLLEAENYHALQMLQWTHEGRVDLIYIDPPYNTGNKSWTYDDDYVAEKDDYRHSKWLSFMERRLRLARRLLSPTGVIVVAIGDEEHHRLRVLMDEVFGEREFISDVVWQGGRKNDSRYISNGADYMLVYARSSERLMASGVRWRERKPGVDEALEQAAAIWDDCGGDHSAATKRWRAWLRAFKATGIPTDSVTRYSTLDAVGRPIRTDGNISWPGGGGPRYDVLHPVTGQPVAVPKRGWRNPDPARMQAEIAAGRIFFGPDHLTQPGGITWLVELDSQVAENVFDRDRNAAANHLERLLGDRRFPNPKDHDVLGRWIRLMAPPNATILDFFGGSGSTLEAVLRLNAEDDGSRQCILVTNNELSSKEAALLAADGRVPGDDAYEARGVFRHVAVPRTRAVLSGQRPDGERHGEPVAGHVLVARLRHLDAERVRDGFELERLLPLLWLRAGGAGAPMAVDDIAKRGWGCTATHGIVVDVDAVDELVAAIGGGVVEVAIVSNSLIDYQQIAAELPEHVRAVHLWDDYIASNEAQRGDAT